MKSAMTTINMKKKKKIENKAISIRITDEACVVKTCLFFDSPSSSSSLFSLFGRNIRRNKTEKYLYLREPRKRVKLVAYCDSCSLWNSMITLQHVSVRVSMILLATRKLDRCASHTLTLTAPVTVELLHTDDDDNTNIRYEQIHETTSCNEVDTHTLTQSERQ